MGRRLVVIKCHFDTPFFFILRTFFEFEKLIIDFQELMKRAWQQ